MAEQKHTAEPWEAGWGRGITGPTSAAVNGLVVEEQIKHRDYDKSDRKGPYPSPQYCPIVIPMEGASDCSKPIAYTVWAKNLPEEESRANAARIVACVNGCANIPDPSAVGELVAEVERELEFTVGDLTGFRGRLLAILNRMKGGE